MSDLETWVQTFGLALAQTVQSRRPPFHAFLCTVETIAHCHRLTNLYFWKYFFEFFQLHQLTSSKLTHSSANTHASDGPMTKLAPKEFDRSPRVLITLHSCCYLWYPMFHERSRTTQRYAFYEHSSVQCVPPSVCRAVRLLPFLSRCLHRSGSLQLW